MLRSTWYQHSCRQSSAPGGVLAGTPAATRSLGTILYNALDPTVGPHCSPGATQIRPSTSLSCARRWSTSSTKVTGSSSPTAPYATSHSYGISPLGLFRSARDGHACPIAHRLLLLGREQRHNQTGPAWSHAIWACPTACVLTKLVHHCTRAMPPPPPRLWQNRHAIVRQFPPHPLSGPTMCPSWAWRSHERRGLRWWPFNSPSQSDGWKSGPTFHRNGNRVRPQNRTLSTGLCPPQALHRLRLLNDRTVMLSMQILQVLRKQNDSLWFWHKRGT
jgi:hypothetical protein